MKNCVILCGGKSSRMGTNKALLHVNGQTLVEYMYKRMQNVFSKVWLSCKADLALPYPCIYDKTEIFAPLVALIECLKALQQPIFFITVDAPLLSYGTIKRIVDAYRAYKGFEAFIPITPLNVHPLCGIYTDRCLGTMEMQYTGRDFRLKHLYKTLRTYFIACSDEVEFSNANTPEDFEKIKHSIKEH